MSRPKAWASLSRRAQSPSASKRRGSGRDIRVGVRFISDPTNWGGRRSIAQHATTPSPLLPPFDVLYSVIRDVFRVFVRDREEVGRLLGVPRMPESWKGWTEARLEKAKMGSADAKPP
jgi:hypothetical protein